MAPAPEPGHGVVAVATPVRGDDREERLELAGLDAGLQVERDDAVAEEAEEGVPLALAVEDLRQRDALVGVRVAGAEPQRQRPEGAEVGAGAREELVAGLPPARVVGVVAAHGAERAAEELQPVEQRGQLAAELVALRLGQLVFSRPRVDPVSQLARVAAHVLHRAPPGVRHAAPTRVCAHGAPRMVRSMWRTLPVAAPSRKRRAATISPRGDARTSRRRARPRSPRSGREDARSPRCGRGSARPCTAHG